jgi:hypothetical protein
MTDFDIAIKMSMLSFKEDNDYQTCLEISKQQYLANAKYPTTCKDTSLCETNVRGDGNCLFRCIAIPQYGDEKYHIFVRQDMISFVSRDKFAYMNSANLVGSIDTWIGRMTNYGNDEFGLPGEFGDSFAIELLSWMMRCPIIVYIKDASSNKLLHTDTTGDWFLNKPAIKLVLHGQHYTLVN